MTHETSTDRLVTDLQTIIKDTETLLKDTGEVLGDKALVAREKLQKGLKEAKVKLDNVQGLVLDKAKEAAHVTDEYVHANPWQAIGIAAGLGVIVGFLLHRR
jgi:ElaB/YqjD/DUF883 family membrane-anchored ribosome-binding protein